MLLFTMILLNKYQKPIFATSVNISGEKPCLTYQEVYAKFNNKVDLIVQYFDESRRNDPGVKDLLDY